MTLHHCLMQPDIPTIIQDQQGITSSETLTKSLTCFLAHCRFQDSFRPTLQ